MDLGIKKLNAGAPLDDGLLQQVDFVLHQNGGNVSDLGLHLLPPAVNSLKRLPVCGGEDQHARLGPWNVRHQLIY